jgi:hypothetical protein
VSFERRTVPAFVGSDDAPTRFPINGGTVWIDHAACDSATAKLVVDHAAELLTLDDAGKPVLAIAEEEVAAKDSELIACEIECRRAGSPVLFVDLPIVALGD